MSLTPKELLKRVAETQDKLTETLTKPVKDLASNLGLPEPPELPKAADLIESLPDLELPTPEALLPLPGVQETTTKREEVTRMKVKKEKIETKLKLKII